MMASIGSRDRSTFISSVRCSTSRPGTAARRGARKGEQKSPGLLTNNSVKIAATRPPFLGQDEGDHYFLQSCPLSQEINAEWPIVIIAFTARALKPYHQTTRILQRCGDMVITSVAGTLYLRSPSLPRALRRN